MRITLLKGRAMKNTLGAIAAVFLAVGSQAQAQQPAADAPTAEPAKPSSGYQGFDNGEAKKADAPVADQAEKASTEGSSDSWSDGTAPVRRSPTDPEATDPRFIKPGRFGPVAFASAFPAVLFAYIPSYAWVIGGGFGFTYDPNGIPGPTGPTLEKFSGTLLLLAEYMVINEGPFAMGPELLLTGSIAPGGFLSRRTISPGLCWWYAPWWNAPVLIGGAWHLQITSVYGLAPIIDFGTPSVRFGFLWR